MTDYYSVLGVPRNATKREITKKYRNLLQVIHPDRNPHSSESDSNIASSTIIEAYSVLNDDTKRKVYDVLGIEGLRSENIGKGQPSPEEIQRRFDRGKHAEETVAAIKKSDLSGSIDCTFNFAEIQDLITRERTLADLISLKLAHSYRIPVSNNFDIKLRADIEAPNTLSSSFSTTFKYLHGSEANSWLQIGSTVVNSYAQIGHWTKISRNTEGELKLLHYRYGHEMEGSIITNLMEDTNGYMTIVAGNQLYTGGRPYTTLKVGAVKKKPKAHHYNGGVEVGNESIGFFTGGSMKLSKQSTFRYDLTVGIFPNVSYNARVLLQRKLSSFPSSRAFIGYTFGNKGISLLLGYSTQHYKVSFPIILSNYASVQDILLLSFFPVCLSALCKYFWWDPALVKKKMRYVDTSNKTKEEEEVISEPNTVSTDKKSETEASATSKSRVNIIREEEESKEEGLVIRLAYYGNFSVTAEELLDRVDLENNPKVVNVTDAVQLLVKDSKLILDETTKDKLPGFSDPCPGEPKKLGIVYRHGINSRVADLIVDDNERVEIPVRRAVEDVD
eukprot:TRINITY_DN13653_c0_g1_i1.p1 TRINITY_DN13653_c0_g1~~TRINITY_DN13653_c0_g1_i1.p1  ORF type:complete len:568 (+),score=94.85 TRINITY_DN13653_c0_g1_i1:28-1704(+)